jgi:hypothetical protein
MQRMSGSGRTSVEVARGQIQNVVVDAGNMARRRTGELASPGLRCRLRRRRPHVRPRA